MEVDDVLLIKMFDSEGEREGSETAMCECLRNFFFPMIQILLLVSSLMILLSMHVVRYLLTSTPRRYTSLLFRLGRRP